MEDPDTSTKQVKPKLLTRLPQAIRVRQYALRTEEVYVGWVRRCIHFHELRHPQDLGSAKLTPFLTRLATEGDGSAQPQAHAALAGQGGDDAVLAAPAGRATGA
ncbi:site-specific integrase [Leptothrix discophora]|nr:site-specific integrase [Leptothrix discophora]